MYIVRSVLLTLVFVASQAWSEGPRLYVFDCGLIRNDDITAYGLKNTDTDVRELFVPCYLIEHGEQRLLWDGGLPLSFVGQSDVEVGEGVYVSYEVSLLDQLDAMGLAPDDIDYVAFSHFHFDHVGAGNAFVNSHLLIQKTEHEAAFEHAE
ncbi:MAG: MBL fold metallo-hydrolase, partial [Gammaproteobacteria bacterium]